MTSDLLTNSQQRSVHAILPRMDNVPRLTKKQKKSLAFRERRKGKPPSASRHEPEMDDTGLPAMENQDVAGISSSGVEARELAENAVHSRRKSTKAAERSGRRKVDTGSSRQRPKENVDVVADTKAKRKRQGDQESATEGQKPKRRKTEREHGDHVEGTESEDGEVMAQTKHRFILFLGTSLALGRTSSSCFIIGLQVISSTLLHAMISCNISLHAVSTSPLLCFSSLIEQCYPDPPPSVRLLTPRLQKTITKSKGCAFLEFTHRNALQQGLKLHHSVLDGRQVNVELSAGGGGKSAARVAKIQKRNKELHDERVRLPRREVVKNPLPDPDFL